MMFAKFLDARLSALAAIGLFALAQPAGAAPLVQYDFAGDPGNQASESPSFVAANLSGVALTRTGLNPTGAVNSFNSNGFNDGGFLGFGFNIANGFSASVNQLTVDTRSSGTGPGFLNLLASIDGGAFTTVASFTENNSGSNTSRTFNVNLLGTSSILFQIEAANQIAANGGPVGAAGTFRLANFQGSAPFTISGDVTALTAAVPEPASWAMMIVGFGLVGGSLRTRSVRATLRFA